MSVLARAAPMLELDLADLVPAEAAALITVRDSRVEFRHPLARSAIYGDAPADQRRAVHRAVASALPDTEADRRAWHLALAAFGPDDAASSALEQAGQRAYQRSAYDVSSRAFERAALLAPDEARQGRLMYAAADAAWLGGLADRAVALLDQSARHVPDPGLAVAIEHLRGHIAIHRGPVTEGQQILLAAAEHAASVDPERAVVMLAEAAYASFTVGDAATMLVAADRAASLAPSDLNGRIAFFALITRGMALIFSGQDELARRLSARLSTCSSARTNSGTSPGCWPGRPWGRPGCARRTSGGHSFIVRSTRLAANPRSARCPSC